MSTLLSKIRTELYYAESHWNYKYIYILNYKIYPVVWSDVTKNEPLFCLAKKTKKEKHLTLIVKYGGVINALSLFLHSPL